MAATANSGIREAANDRRDPDSAHHKRGTDDSMASAARVGTSGMTRPQHSSRPSLRNHSVPTTIIRTETAEMASPGPKVSRLK